jgi:hypothetical protein
MEWREECGEAAAGDGGETPLAGVLMGWVGRQVMNFRDSWLDRRELARTVLLMNLGFVPSVE